MERKKSLISYEIETKENKIYVNFADGEYIFERGFATCVQLRLMVNICEEAIVKYYRDSLFGEYNFSAGLLTSNDLRVWKINSTKLRSSRIHIWRRNTKWARAEYVNGVRKGKILTFNSLMGALLCDSNA